MLIDLGRNDVGRVARGRHACSVAEQMVIERYSHVMHLTSHVVGTLADGQDAGSTCCAPRFPAGTLSGAPKIRAMEIIDELEPHQRGIYGGAVGYVSYTGNLDHRDRDPHARHAAATRSTCRRAPASSPTRSRRRVRGDA